MRELTKGQKRALREAADLASRRDTSMGQEDREVHYLDARNDDLPIIVGGAVANGYISIDEVGEAARELVAATAETIRDFQREYEQREAPVVEDPYDPNAVVSVSNIVEQMDLLGNDATLYVNRETGEVTVSSRDDWSSEDDEVDALDEDPSWVALFSSFDQNDFEVMKKFAYRVAGPAAGRDLSDALRGRGAYRRFRDVIHRRGLEKEWDDYRTERRASLVRFELQQHEIPFRR